MRKYIKHNNIFPIVIHKIDIGEGNKLSIIANENKNNEIQNDVSNNISIFTDYDAYLLIRRP